MENTKTTKSTITIYDKIFTLFHGILLLVSFIISFGSLFPARDYPTLPYQIFAVRLFFIAGVTFFPVVLITFIKRSDYLKVGERKKANILSIFGLLNIIFIALAFLIYNL